MLFLLTAFALESGCNITNISRHGKIKISTAQRITFPRGGVSNVKDGLFSHDGPPKMLLLPSGIGRWRKAKCARWCREPVLGKETGVCAPVGARCPYLAAGIWIVCIGHTICVFLHAALLRRTLFLPCCPLVVRLLSGCCPL